MEFLNNAPYRFCVDQRGHGYCLILQAAAIQLWRVLTKQLIMATGASGSVSCPRHQAPVESKSRHGQRATVPFTIPLQLPASLRGLCDLEAAQGPSLTGVPLSNLYLLLTTGNSQPKGFHKPCTSIQCWKSAPFCGMGNFCLSGLRTFAILEA